MNKALCLLVFFLVSLKSFSTTIGHSYGTFEKGKFSEVTKGLRAYKHKEKIKKNDPFHLGSNTKSMTAYMVAKLINRGDLSFETKISRILKMKMHESVSSITIGELLSQRSGLDIDLLSLDKGKFFKSFLKSKLSGKEDRKRLLARVLPLKATGKKEFHYSNINHIILGHILEVVHQKEFADILKSELFKPLKMEGCGLGAPGKSKRSPDAPWMHYQVANKIYALPPGPLSDNPKVFSPAGRVHCPLSSWAKFLEETMRAIRGDSKTFKNDVRIVLYSTPKNSTYSYSGFVSVYRGWAKGYAYMHSGSNTLSSSLVWLAPSLNRFYVVAANSAFDDFHSELDKIIGTMIETR